MISLFWLLLIALMIMSKMFQNLVSMNILRKFHKFPVLTQPELFSLMMIFMDKKNLLSRSHTDIPFTNILKRIMISQFHNWTDEWTLKIGKVNKYLYVCPTLMKISQTLLLKYKDMAKQNMVLKFQIIINIIRIWIWISTLSFRYFIKWSSRRKSEDPLQSRLFQFERLQRQKCFWCQQVKDWKSSSRRHCWWDNMCCWFRFR